MFVAIALVVVALISLSSPTILPVERGLSGLFSPRATSECPFANSASCTNTTAISDTCCFESPGGLLLLSQFWTVNPPTGPSDSWTIHGLWPDLCNGEFIQDCDPSRAYTDITGLLTSAGESDTLSTMQRYWPDYHGRNEQFWEHEWSKHGTCMSTLRPQCLPDESSAGTDAILYFKTIIRLFRAYDIYKTLKTANIRPGATYSLSSLQAALRRAFKVMPDFRCTRGNLDQIYLYFHLRGSAIDGQFIPIDAPTRSNCPARVNYPVKRSPN
ncbi:hypothetical protein AMATHDRAFT_61815 [Amanita thiersii Skay4041]|uniref:ribonuclease T2 n=1 Tax=Amanita thiersii Skay4041 TaxID=703135 RepID=A0A2A9NHH5_9AGAR|nr:hypothetical protein AMATHDRAFT_61815 [Amanita thiersii Skay4041]